MLLGNHTVGVKVVIPPHPTPRCSSQHWFSGNTASLGLVVHTAVVTSSHFDLTSPDWDDWQEHYKKKTKDHTLISWLRTRTLRFQAVNPIPPCFNFSPFWDVSLLLLIQLSDQQYKWVELKPSAGQVERQTGCNCTAFMLIQKQAAMKTEGCISE